MMDPCGTPRLIALTREWLLLTRTVIVLRLRKSSIQATRYSGSRILRSFSTKIACSTMSYAAEKSTRTAYVLSPAL
jgi:hypothetical protein